MMLWLSLALAGGPCSADDPEVWQCVFAANQRGEEVLAFAETLQEDQPSSQGWLTLGNLYADRADVRALDAFREAASGFEAEGNHRKRLFAELNLATALRHEGDAEAGAELLAAAVERTADEPQLHGMVVLERARFVSQVGGDLAGALRDLLALEPQLEKMPPHGTILWWQTKGSLELSFGEEEQAARSFRSLAEFADELGAQSVRLSALSNALEADSQAGVVDSIWWDRLESALAAAEGDVMLPHRAALLCRAAARSEGGAAYLPRCEEAAALLPEATEISLDARLGRALADQDGEELLALADDGFLVSTDAQLRALELATRVESTRERARDALFAAVEEASAQVTDPLLSTRFQERWAATLRALAPTETGAVRAYHERHHTWRASERGRRVREVPAELGGVVAQLERARMAGDGDEVRRLAREAARLQQVGEKALEVSELPALHEGQVVVSFLLGEEAGQAWVLDTKGERVVALAGLEESRASALAGLLATNPASAEPALDGLYEDLVQPLGIEPGADLVVVLDGALQSVGLEALSERAGWASITVTPSLSAWAAWASTPAVPGPISVLAGDVPAATESSARAQLGKLAAAAGELEHASSLVVEPLRLTGEAATEDAIEKALTNAGLVHFATHATVDPSDPAGSAVYLAPSGERDGVWAAREIALLSLAEPLVILSACSGAGGEPSGRGTLGLAQTFLDRGARAVVASRWPVADQEAAGFAAALHEALASGEPVGRAAALARQNVSASTGAAFMVLGDGAMTRPGTPRTPSWLLGGLVGVGMALAGAAALVARRPATVQQ